ncbi:MAG: hypothetical protein D6773_02080, partial [Alphaproteobacteria bacterium]
MDSANSRERRRIAPPGGHIDYFEADDGLAIRFGLWRPRGVVQGTMLVVHGRTEFIEKYYETIHDCLDRSLAVATFDWRGQGLSGRGTADPYKDHQDSFD